MRSAGSWLMQGYMNEAALAKTLENRPESDFFKPKAKSGCGLKERLSGNFHGTW